MIGGIREVLRLQAETVAALVDMAVLTDNRTVKEIASVELDAGLRGRDFEHTSASGLVGARRQREAVAFAVDDPVVVVAVAEDDLFVRVVDAGADPGGSGEIERRALDRAEFAGGDEVLIDRGEAV